MNRLRRHTYLAMMAALCALASLLTLQARADALRTQTISLRKGWNSIYLQVTPTNTNAAAVFANTPVTTVATYFGGISSVEFIQNPGSIKWKKDGWAVWYAPSRPDSFLSSLNVINGNSAYLVYSLQDFTWTVQGTVTLQSRPWKSDSFNFVGFCVDDQSPPTLDKFFANSSAHKPNKIYRLINEQWTLVTDPIHTTMNSGEGYWIYCKGGSDYQGPLSAKIAGSQKLMFGESGQAWIHLFNRSSDPMDIKVETITGGDIGVPMAYKIQGVSTNQIQDVLFDLPQIYQLPSLEPGKSTGLWLSLRRERMTKSVQSTLLKITANNGAQAWIPVTGTRNDLPEN